MSTGPRLLVIQHEPDAPLGWLGDWWNELGVKVTVVRADRGQVVPDRVDGHDGLVVLGGAMGCSDDALAPWLPATRRLLAHAVTTVVPTLGVCLGHQLAAVALRGAVTRNPSGRTVGLVPVRLTAAGADDPLLAGSGGLPAVHYNDDVVLEPPIGARVLATLPDGRPQALRLGPAAWGVQFHPETSPEIFGTWLRWDSPDGLTTEQEELLASVTGAREVLRAAWRPLAERFAAITVRNAVARRAAPVTS